MRNAGTAIEPGIGVRPRSTRSQTTEAARETEATARRRAGVAWFQNQLVPPTPMRLQRRPARADVRTVTHLVNVLAATFLFYAAVTRGALVVARVLEKTVPRR